MKVAASALVAGAVAIALGVLPTDAPAQEKVSWKMHAAFPKTTAVIGPPPHRIAAAVNQMSGGMFDINVLEPNALAAGYAYYEPVSKGAIDAAFGTPLANQGKNSAYAFLSTWPFGPAAPEFVAWMLYGGGVDIASEMYARDNIKYILCGMTPPESSGWFKQEITQLSQLNGLRMRFYGMGARVMQKFGVVTQQLTAAETYPALAGDTIDATEFSMPAIDRSLGFYKAAKFNYFPGWHQQTMANEILVNMDIWNELPEPFQAMLETACRANVTDMIADGEAAQFDAMLENERNDVKNVRWPDPMLNAFRDAWDELRDEEVAANADVKKVWDSYSAFHEKYRVWGRNAYLD